MTYSERGQNQTLKYSVVEGPYSLPALGKTESFKKE